MNELSASMAFLSNIHNLDDSINNFWNWKYAVADIIQLIDDNIKTWWIFK